MESKLSDIWLIANLEEARIISTELYQQRQKISFLVRPFNAEELRDILQYVFMPQLKHGFAITVDAREIFEEKGDEWVDILCLLLFHPEYYKSQEKVIVTFLAEKEIYGQTDLVKNRILQGISSQGIDNIGVVDLNSTETKPDLNHGITYIQPALFESIEKFTDFYLSSLLGSEDRLQLFIRQDTGLTNCLQDFITDAESKLFQEEMHLVRLIQLLHKKSVGLQDALHVNKLLEEDLKAKKDYLDYIFRKANDSDAPFSDLLKLKKYYTNEYEVLPLWYKRFGHIIKVVMGKRTFRSLFSNEVKKYKD
ncbi:hypothetical protein [Terrimonas pollutisoli]|uniref:hypothetical protein n=1 Tax=Terrimonas pollutisoli TaxID=3034147 RepID=UPI0023EBB3C0|nr:hypothetical protein [Terrimonas sp. H1YJ31]